jgi:sigma-B regulation protein RsbQ
MRTPERVELIERPDGCSLELRVYNPAARRTLVFTNGLGCDDVLWRHLLDDLAADHCVVTWDFRGQGGSSEAQGTGAYALGAHAADLAAVQAAVGADCASLIGFGMGALVTLVRARSATRGEVASMVLIQGGMHPALVRLPAASELAFRLLSAAAPLAPWWLGLARRLGGWDWLHPLALRLQLLGATCDKRELGVVLASAGEGDAMVQLEIARNLAISRERDLFSPVRVPVLIFGAARDPLCPESVMLAVHERIAGSEYVSLPGASHASLIEVGPIIAGKVRRFLEAFEEDLKKG